MVEPTRAIPRPGCQRHSRLRRICSALASPAEPPGGSPASARGEPQRASRGAARRKQGLGGPGGRLPSPVGQRQSGSEPCQVQRREYPSRRPSGSRHKGKPPSTRGNHGRGGREGPGARGGVRMPEGGASRARDEGGPEPVGRRTLYLPPEPAVGPFGLDFAIAHRFGSLYPAVASDPRERRRLAPPYPDYTSGFPLQGLGLGPPWPSGALSRPSVGSDQATINHTVTVLPEFDGVRVGFGAGEGEELGRGGIPEDPTVAWVPSRRDEGPSGLVGRRMGCLVRGSGRGARRLALALRTW